MAEVTDYYTLLGVSETASPEVIKRAYRSLARESHPDRNPGDPNAEERFKAVQRAYHVLSDPRRREAYDAARHSMFGGLGGGLDGRARPQPSRSSQFGPDGYDPLISLFFGDEQVPAGRGADVEAQVKLTFDQALRGGRTEVRLVDGETVRLTVPKGVRSGLKVRVRGRGRAGGGGERGDLYVTFRVDPVARFRREGDNLHVVEIVSAVEAMLGTTRSITNAYGQTVKVHIPPGTQPGERLRLRGQGVETDSRRGDLFVEVQVTVPRSLTDEQREALEEAARRVGLL
jgi:DnaJ-class molecular chaperone